MPAAQPLQTFGYSLSGSRDMDHNTYPDLVVGAYDSAKTLVLRARPVVHVSVDLDPVPHMINASLTQCQFNGRNNKCFRIQMYFNWVADPVER